MEKKDMSDQIDRVLYITLERIEPPEGSKELTLNLINNRITKMRKRKFWGFSFLGLTSLAGLLYSIWFLILEWQGMETTHYLKLLFTDTSVVLSNFYHWLGLVQESIPWVSLFLVVTLVTVLYSLAWQMGELIRLSDGLIKGGKA